MREMNGEKEEGIERWVEAVSLQACLCGGLKVQVKSKRRRHRRRQKEGAETERSVTEGT